MIKIYFDMDGTLAKFFHDKKCLEKMYTQGYFLALKPYKLIETAIELSKQEGVQVGIISACVDSPYCKSEKLAWLDKYFPQASKRVLCWTGENKVEILTKQEDYNDNDIHILIDDYSKNLYEWEVAGKNFISIKYCNGFNNKTDKEYGYMIKNGKQLLNIIKKIKGE